MTKEHKLIRLYQYAQNNSLFTIDFRISDGFYTDETLSIDFKITGLHLHTKIRLHGTKCKTPCALSNLSCSKLFPKEKIVFISEEVENQLLELTEFWDCGYSDKARKTFNSLFNNMIDKIEITLKENTNYKQTDYYYRSFC